MSGIVIYLGTDVDITISLTGLEVGSASEITAILHKDGSPDIEFTKSDGDITVNGSDLNLRIDDGAIPNAGTYEVRMTATISGDIRGLSLTPNRIQVK